MQTKTAAGTFAPLLALGIAAVVGACATQEDAQPDQFNQSPVVMAVYARDSVGNALPDVQMWANPTDPHYPNFGGVTGPENAQNVSPFPASYGSLVIEFNTPLDGDLLQIGDQYANQLGSYCKMGFDPNTAPFKIVDPSRPNAPLFGSICYDPTSPLSRFPSLTFVIGSGTATDASANPFTCQTFTPASFLDNATGTALPLKPLTTYTVVFSNTAVTNPNHQSLSFPTGNGWSSGQYQFTTSGFEIMAAGYKDQGSGYYTFIDKPYKGLLKDLAAVGASNYQQPADDTPFFVVTTYGFLAKQPDPNNGTVAGDCVPTGKDGKTPAVTATRADGSHFDEFIINDSCAGGLVNGDARFIYVAPGYSLPGHDTPALGGGATWEPNQSYTITVDTSLADQSNLVTLGNTTTYQFTAADDSPRMVSIAPANGGVAQLAYGKNGPAGATYYFSIASPLSSSQPSFIVANYNAPIDTSATSDNFVVTDPSGAVVPGTVTFPASMNNQAIAFQPTQALLPATAYKIDIKGLKVAAAIPGLGGQAFGEKHKTFTTSTMRTSSLQRICIDYPNNNECGGNFTHTSSDRAANQPLQILHAGDVAGDNLVFSFSRPAVGVTSSTVAVQEINADGTNGDAIDPALVTVTAASTVVYTLAVDPKVPVKCNQKYEIIAQTGITDTETTPVNLTAEGCKVNGGCPDIRSFTTQPYEPLPQDSAGNAVLYTPTGQPDPLTGKPLTADEYIVEFNASISAGSVNSKLLGVPSTSNLLQVVDSNGVGVKLTCPKLPDDNQYLIVCTSAPLAANANYLATMLVDSSSPILIATSTTLAPLGVDYQGQANAFSNTPSASLVGDQNSCKFFGTVATSITTPCPPSTTKSVGKKSVARTASAKLGKLALR